MSPKSAIQQKMPFETNSCGKRLYTVMPSRCLALLPFKAEPISHWGKSSDLAEFRGKYAQDCDVTEEEWDAPIHVASLADEFTQGSTSGYHERRKQKQGAINYRRSPEFGGFAKAWEVWNDVDRELLTEAGFFSIAHTLEANTDIDCAIVLVKQFYYRQAFICLRTFLEDVVFPLYYLQHPGEFEKWRLGANAHLSLRGRDGAVARLCKKGVFDQALAARISTAYGEHNPAVHGHADAIINAGMFDRNWRGLSFKSDELREWLIKAKECLEIGLAVVKLTSDAWLASLRCGPVVCDTCHSTDFVITKYLSKPARDTEFKLGSVMITLPAPTGPRQAMYRYRCRRCGRVLYSTQSRRENELLKVGRPMPP